MMDYAKASDAHLAALARAREVGRLAVVVGGVRCGAANDDWDAAPINSSCSNISNTCVDTQSPKSVTAKRPRPANHVLKPCVAESVVELIRIGASLRAIVQHTGVAKGTAVAYKRKFLADGGTIEPCLCGKPADHRGWCAVRFERSEARQWTVRALHLARVLRSRPDIFYKTPDGEWGLVAWQERNTATGAPPESASNA